MLQLIHDLLGLDLEAKQLGFWQITGRTLIVFVATLVMVRTADRRFLAKKSAFDAILGFLLASMLARAVNGSSSFFPTIGAGFAMVWFHRALAMAACRLPRFGDLIKGYPDKVVEEGKTIPHKMREAQINEDDLLEDCHLKGVGEISQIKTAWVERNGEVSVLRKDPK